MTDTDGVGLDHNPILTDTAATVTMIPTEAAPGHITGTPGDITGVFHNVYTLECIHTILTTTLHIDGHLYTRTHQHPHEIAADHALNWPTGQLRKPHIRIHHIQEDPMVIHALNEI